MHAIPLCKCTMIHSTTVLHLPVFVVSNLLLLNIELRWLNTILWCSLSWQVGQDTSSYAGWRPTSTSSHARSQPQSRTRDCRLAPKIPCRPVTLFRPTHPHVDTLLLIFCFPYGEYTPGTCYLLLVALTLGGKSCLSSSNSSHMFSMGFCFVYLKKLLFSHYAT